MKVTRSYWLGLGSGLILSAMLTLVISPQLGQAVIPQAPFSVPEQQAANQSLAGGVQADPPSTVQPFVPMNQPSQVQPLNTQSSTPIEQSFNIPQGASSKRIAELLVNQGFLKDRETFLGDVQKMGVERQFRAGTFTLSLGLTPEEVIQRLLKRS